MRLFIQPWQDNEVEKTRGLSTLLKEKETDLQLNQMET